MYSVCSPVKVVTWPISKTPWPFWNCIQVTLFQEKHKRLQKTTQWTSLITREDSRKTNSSKKKKHKRSDQWLCCRPRNKETRGAVSPFTFWTVKLKSLKLVSCKIWKKLSPETIFRSDWHGSNTYILSLTLFKNRI